MNSEDDVTPATISNIAWDIQENNADPEDVRRILTYFCVLVDERRAVPDGLQSLLRDCFRAYLNGSAKTVDQAIGLVRSRRGRPPVDKVEQAIIAARVLEARIAHSTLQDALEEVAEKHECHKTKVGDAWGKFKGHAVPMLLVLRSFNGEGQFTAAEWERVRKIFGKDHTKMEKWFSEQPRAITPEK